jgi:ABC-type nitrate/sulfonate/bicarbonate transport system permease component
MKPLGDRADRTGMATSAEPVAEEVALPALEPDAEVRALRRANVRDRVIMIVTPLLLLGVWQIAATTGAVDARFFPAPTSIASTFGQLVANGVLPGDLGVTVRRMLIGLVLGGIPGIIIGTAAGLSRIVRAIIKPIVASLFPIPQIAILPLILLIFGLGETSKYASIALGVFWLMIINTMAAVIQIESIYLDVGRNFGASRWQFFSRIVVPGAMPGILTGLQLALTVSLLIAIATEFLAATSGIGYLIWNSWTIFDVQEMYAGLVVCAGLGIAFQLAIDLLRRLLIPWLRTSQR